jgi:hypothetical protein
VSGSQLALVVVAVAVLDAAGTVPAIWVLRDVRRRSPEAFAAIGSSQSQWSMWPFLGAAFLGIGALVPVGIYALKVRPRLDAPGVPG